MPGIYRAIIVEAKEKEASVYIPALHREQMPFKLDEDGKTDAVSGCTIKIDALYEALENALNQAKK